jgi:hypothetical protein
MLRKIYKTYLVASAAKCFIMSHETLNHRVWHALPQMDAVRAMMPLDYWGYLFAFLGFGFSLCFAAYITLGFRTSIMNIFSALAASVFSMWAIGFVLSGFDSGLVLWMLPALFTYVALVHMVIPQMPLTKYQITRQLAALIKDEGEH